ncbi:hypothetical protein ACB092_02G104000 [Castanea dentata]
MASDSENVNFTLISNEPKWSNGLYECGVNKCTCCITCCFPCITHGQIAEALDEGRSSCCRNGCLYFFLMGSQVIGFSHGFIEINYEQNLDYH